MKTESINPAPWCWTADIEAETWDHAGNSREEALAYAKSEAGGRESWIAPTRSATARDVADWMGDEDIEVGDPIIIFDRIEDVPAAPAVRTCPPLSSPAA